MTEEVDVSDKIVAILRVISLLNAVLTDEELDSLIDALFVELGVTRPKKSQLSLKVEG